MKNSNYKKIKLEFEDSPSGLLVSRIINDFIVNGVNKTMQFLIYAWLGHGNFEILDFSLQFPPNV